MPGTLSLVYPWLIWHVLSPVRAQDADRVRAVAAGMLIAYALSLVYTSIVVPVQLCMWTYDDPCNRFPTLYFDILVDTFFMVRSDAPVVYRC